MVVYKKMFVFIFLIDFSLYIVDVVVKSIVLVMIINFWGGGVKRIYFSLFLCNKYIFVCSLCFFDIKMI